MATTNRLRPTRHRLIIITAILLTVGATALIAGVYTADAQADLTLGELTVGDTEQTVDGEVSDVELGATLDYSYEVPDGTRRIVQLEARQPGGEWQTVDYAQDEIAGGSDTGTVLLSGSLLDATDLTTGDVSPALAESETTDLEVRASIEIRRDGGDAVTHNVTDTTTLTLTDSTELTATVGGSGTLTVQE
jgi:hypothetical protein